MKFKVGDRVVCSRKGKRTHLTNMMGTIVKLPFDESGFFAVDLDKNPEGSKFDYGNKGWYFPFDELRPLTALEELL
jgi:hypothetical protein